MSLQLTSYKGTSDLYPAEMAKRRYIFNIWRQVMHSYGYLEYATPLIEPIEIYAAKSGQEIVNDQTYIFTDRGGRSVVIRPEMTPSVARIVAAKRQDLAMPARLYSIANFMRYERPQRGREREFWQLNFDLFGLTTYRAELEVIRISYDILSKLGAQPTMFTIKINSRPLTNFIMSQYLGLADQQTHQLIKLLDRYDKLPYDSFASLAQQIIDSNQLDQLKKLLNVEQLADLPVAVKDSQPARQLADILNSLQQLGITNARYDIKLMRGFDYYTGTVFEIFDNHPDNQRAIFGGGRYDKLVELFGVEPLAVVGAAPGETTVINFMDSHNLWPANLSEV